MRDKLTEYSIGKKANILLEEFGARIGDQERRLIQDMKGLYRAGKLSEREALTKVASLVSLEDLLNQIKRDIRKGQEAGKELHDA